MKLTIVAGARPNFMKIAPIINAVKKQQDNGVDIQYRLVHTGQHYDEMMSKSFFEQLQLPNPDINLECGGGTQNEQTAAIMIKFEKELIAHKSDIVIVVGDVNSTMACAIVAQKLNVKVAHVEAGIRSGDWAMPEEINRMVTDSISNFFFTTTKHAGKALQKTGVGDERIFFVGNTMIDTLLRLEPSFRKPSFFDEVGLTSKEYIVVTLHRPSNVDEKENLGRLIHEIVHNANGLPVIFPVHPRTRKNLSDTAADHAGLHLVEPMSYLEFNYLVKNAKAVITDSGGITEETTVMGIPCITLRNSTERPETVEIGTNELIGTDPSALAPYMQKLFSGTWKKGNIPELWDGKTGERIVSALLNVNKTSS